LKLKTHQFIQKGMASLVVRVLGAGAAFLANIFLSRTLGAELAGLFFLGFTLVTIGAYFCRLGFDRVVTQHVVSFETSDDLESINGLFDFVIWRVLLASSLFTAFLYFISPWLAIYVFAKPNLTEVLQTMAFSIIPLTLTFSLGAFFQGRMNIVAMQVAQSFGVPALLLVILSCAWFSADKSLSLSAASLSLVASGCLLFPLLFSYWRNGSPSAASLIKSDKIWLSALPYWVVVIIGLGISWCSTLALGAWGTSSELAIFTNAVRTSMLVLLVLQSINSFVGPKLAEGFNDGNMDSVKRTSVLATRLALLVGIPATLFLVAFSSEVMSVFGPEFATGGNTLLILALGQLVSAGVGPVGWILSMGNGERVLMYISALSAAIMVVFCLLLIPRFGLLGAAVAHAASSAIQNVLCMLAVKRLFGFYTLEIQLEK
jgi:O-antigen/teichoic acid export membrane protein